MVLSIFVEEQCRRVFVNIDPYYGEDEEFCLKDTEMRVFESLQTFIQSVNNDIIFDMSDDVPKIISKQNLQTLNQTDLEDDYTYEDSEVLFEQNVQNLKLLSIQNDNVDDNKKKESSLSSEVDVLSDDVPKIISKQNLQNLNQTDLEDDYTYEDSEVLFEQNVQNLKLLSIQNDNVDDNKKKDSSLSSEDDVYLRYRNEAFKMTSIAKRLFEDYENAYLKHDYILANQLCQESKKAWQIVDNLHAVAAKNIFRIKNQQNGLMKIDLHGLHPSEAIEATRERLSMIETNKKIMIASFTCSNKKPIYLKVITGVGKHSRHGVAKIPTAVKTFLTDKGYEFFESMPGVIMVRPKFCAD